MSTSPKTPEATALSLGLERPRELSVLIVDACLSREASGGASAGWLVSMEDRSACQIMDKLIVELAAVSGSACERVIDEFSGGIKSGTGTGDAPETKPIHARADAVIEELRKSWGPTADPDLANDVVPGRGADVSSGGEEDCLFALFRRPGVWAYVRLRALRDETPETARLRLILGVARDV